VRIALVAAVLALTACGGGQRSAAPACTLGRGEPPTPETGEHPVAISTSCALDATPRIDLFGLHGRRLGFTYVQEGGPRGTHTVLLDKYRCDIRYRDLAHTVALGGARLDIGRSLLDWCPEQAVSSVVHVYLGGRHAPATWRGVLRDVYDGHLDYIWPCGALRAAIAHLPTGRVYSTLPRQLARAAAPACEAALAGIPRGAPRFAVTEALGVASFGGPRCPVWRWLPVSGPVDGARICFERGRAALVQTALHG
jgi:hypothetical protein